MIKKTIIYIIITIVLLYLVACSNTGLKRYSAEFLFLFDTTTQIVGYSTSEEEFSDYVNFIHKELEEYHQLYDIYNEYDGINNVKTINDNAGISPVKVDKRIIDLLLFAKKAYQDTDGKVNIALGSVLSIWHEYRTKGVDDPENAKLPPLELLEKANSHTDIDNVIIDKLNSTVYLSDSEMSLDLGAIAKGYAVEQVSKAVEKKGLTSGLIIVGGNVRAIGYKGEDNEFWNIGIRNPDMQSDEGDLYRMNIAGMSIVSSGDYLRYYTVEGKKYHHIIDPDTLYPSEYYRSVTVICEDSGIADVLSTALYNMPIDQGKKLVESREGVEALWVYNDGEQEYSSGFFDYVSASLE
ncbi:MAG: FAD:protein FMN transferase [Clostridiales bacterium]|jgi:thiamine biosynthesis lipoprotein|nr:FAD:protein FMN transferase [Clostridiales bacterium]